MDHFYFLKGKRVLLVSHELSLTGAPLLLVEIGSMLLRAGADVSLLNFGWREHCFPDALLNGFRLTEVDRSVDEAAHADLILANTAVVKHWVRDVLTLHPHMARKLIWWIHEIDTELYGKCMEPLASVAWALFDSYACVSAWERFGCPLPAKTRVIHPCVDERFALEADRMVREEQALRQAVRQQLGVGPDELLLSLFGSYEPRKGQDALVATIGTMLEEQPGLPVKLLLIGFGTEEARQEFLNKLTEPQRRAISPARALARMVDLKPYYLASDVFVMNSGYPGEPFGRVTIEAMAFRLPVLGSDRGGTVEIVIDGVTGWLHPSRRDGQNQLAHNICEVLRDRQQASARGERGRRRVREYFYENRFCRELAEVMKSVE